MITKIMIIIIINFQERNRVKNLLDQEEVMNPDLFHSVKQAIIPLLHDSTYATMRTVQSNIKSKTNLNEETNAKKSESALESEIESDIEGKNGSERDGNEGGEGEEDSGGIQLILGKLTSIPTKKIDNKERENKDEEMKNDEDDYQGYEIKESIETKKIINDDNIDDNNIDDDKEICHSVIASKNKNEKIISPNIEQSSKCRPGCVIA